MMVDVKLLLQHTIKVNANAIILCHNHPSGNLKPGEADNSITREVKAAALLMDIQQLDHLIIIPELSYSSFGDEGLM